jgi:hypothetical protein
MHLPRKSWFGLTTLLFAALVIISARSPFEKPVPTYAQADNSAACENLITTAIQQIGSACRELGRNEACYGNTRVSATLNDPELLFLNAGDIVSVLALDAIITRPANPETNEWGIALMDLQADLPASEAKSVRLVMFGGVDVAPNQASVSAEHPTCTFTNTASANLRFRAGPALNYRVVDILDQGRSVEVYGKHADANWLRAAEGWIYAPNGTLACEDGATLASMDNTLDAYAAPMQSFTLQVTDNGQCQAAPSGLLIQAPSGQIANILVNNVELRIGSTAFITMPAAEIMTVANFDGNVGVTALQRTFIMPVGAQVDIELRNGVPASTPRNLRPIDGAAIALDPRLLATLPKPIQRPAPFEFSPPSGSGSGANTAPGPVTPATASLDCPICGSIQQCNVGGNFSTIFTYSSTDQAVLRPGQTQEFNPSVIAATVTELSNTQRSVFFICQIPGNTSYHLVITDTSGRTIRAGFGIQIN